MSMSDWVHLRDDEALVFLIYAELKLSPLSRPILLTMVKYFAFKWKVNNPTSSW